MYREGRALLETGISVCMEVHSWFWSLKYSLVLHQCGLNIDVAFGIYFSIKAANIQ